MCADWAPVGIFLVSVCADWALVGRAVRVHGGPPACEMSEDYSCRCVLIGLLWEYSYRCALIGIPWLAGAGGAGHRERDGVVVLRVPHHGLLLSQVNPWNMLSSPL